jgi:hypothetical protein
LTPRTDSKATKDESSRQGNEQADRPRIQNPAMTRDSLVDMNASTSAPSRQVPSKNTINQQQSRPGTKQAAMASKIDDSWSNRCEITKSSNPGEAETAAVVIASKKDSTQPTRVDKKRRFRSPPITANEAIDTKELLGMEAMSPPSHSSSSDDSATTNDRIESIASVFRKKPSSSLSKGLRVEAPIFVPRSVAPSIPRASRLASFDEANTRHSTAVVEHKKSPSSYSIAKGASTFGYYLLEAPNRTPLWAPESMSMSQSRHADIPKNHGRQLKILPPRADSSAVPLYANSSLVTQRHSFIFQGMKVTMVDETTKVFVIDLLLRKECKAIRSMIDEHVAEVTKRGEEAKGWRSLYTYTKMDLPCSEIATMQPVVAMIMRRVVRVVGHVYENIKAASKLKPRSWKEPHFLKYQKKKDLPYAKLFVKCACVHGPTDLT